MDVYLARFVYYLLGVKNISPIPVDIVYPVDIMKHIINTGEKPDTEIEMTQTAHTIRQLKADGTANTNTLQRVALVWGVLQWTDTNHRGNCDGFGVKNTRDRLPVPVGWVAVA